MKCIVCSKQLQKPQRKFCSNNCKQKDSYKKTKDTNPNTSFSQLKGFLKRKLEAVNLLGGSCSKCGYNKNLSALQFHHINSYEKSFPLDARAFGNRSKEVLLLEIAKCRVLCANCHAEEHYPENTIENIQNFVKNIPKIKTLEYTNKELVCSICGGSRVGRKSDICRQCSNIRTRKFERPSAEELIFDKIELKTFYKISKKYGCTHKTIEKWFLRYNIRFA